MVIAVLAIAIFFYLTISIKRDKCPWLNSQMLHALKILVAHQLKIAALCQWIKKNNSNPIFKKYSGKQNKNKC